MASAKPSLHAVVLAGGAGERFWPQSRAHYPKPLLEVVGGESLLGATIERARRYADDVWLVCGADHAGVMRKAAGLTPNRTLVEPARCNTAMAVGLAALRILRDDPDGVMTVLPADHHIPDTRAFAAAIRKAARAAQREGVLLTLGIRPTRPDTGYGYIRTGEPAGEGYPGLHRVQRFVEKPDAKRAEAYLADGGYLWNAGIFVWRADAIWREIQSCAPEIGKALAPMARWAGLDKAPRGKMTALSGAIRRAYRGAPSHPIDTAVLERSRQVWCLPVGFRWSDVGTWESLAQEVGVSANVTRVIAGEVIMHDAEGNLVWGGDRPIVLLGVSDLAVIDADDALLVTRLDRSPEVKAAVSSLRKRGRRDLL